MLLAELAATSAAVAATRARSRKTELLAQCLRDADADEVVITVSYLSGELLQRRTGVGWAALRDLPPPVGEPSLTLADVDAAFGRLSRSSGSGAQARRRDEISALYARATAQEQQFLTRLALGELRQGALESLVVDAVAQAAQLPASQIRRAVMLRGALGPVAAAVLARGPSALEDFHLEVGRPVQPMLAHTATSVTAALAKLGTAAIDWKLDGVRVQIHRDGETVRVFTRTLDDITARVPELARAVHDLDIRSAVLDGEAIALDENDRPRPFQVTASRVGSRIDLDRVSSAVPLRLFLFDLLHLDGTDLLGRPGAERVEQLTLLVPERLRVPRRVTGDPGEGEAFLVDALAHGHEGVVVKSLAAPYDAGRRGAGWLKVKPVHTLDLVVLAAEWGHGRRRGWLSNLHLGARDPAGGFVMLGKTFKGLTDAMLTWQTQRLLEIEESRNDWQVFVRPELVVEVAFDGVQTSSRYPGGMALRFARVLRYRDDKSAGEADTVDQVRAFHAR